MKKLPPEIRKANKAESRRRHYFANRDKYIKMERERCWLKRYGITPERYRAMLDAQGHCCAICRSKKAGSRMVFFAIDHSHETGQVRGLLCQKCNSLLGWFEAYSDSILGYVMPNPHLTLHSGEK